MTTDFGSDFDCTDDLTAEMREVSGPMALAQNVYRRLSTPRGMVIDAPDYGRDLRDYLHKGLTPTEQTSIPGEVRAEVLKEQRIENADVRVTSFADEAMTLAIRCESAEGPFSLTLDVTAAAVVLAEVR
jgi:phage baseplate assembly protein W